MKRTIVAIATLLAAAGIAHAQTSTTPSSPSATTPPSGGSATTMPGSSGAMSGAAGAMSPSAVKSKIEASGYSNVTNLKQDNAGGWTAQATKGGQQVAIAVDSKGSVKQAQQ
jgi:protein CpxP